MQQINDEYEASKQAVQGLAQGTARHEFITTKMEKMYVRVMELHKIVGEEAAIQAMISWQDEAAKEIGHA
jgi:hypothetical protein